jgi:hypothetical protein
MEGWDGRDRPGSIQVQTLVIWGEGDRSYGWHLIKAPWRQIPSASLAMLSHCSHALHLERAVLFHMLVLEFLQPGGASGRRLTWRGIEPRTAGPQPTMPAPGGRRQWN